MGKGAEGKGRKIVKSEPAADPFDEEPKLREVLNQVHPNLSRDLSKAHEKHANLDVAPPVSVRMGLFRGRFSLEACPLCAIEGKLQQAHYLEKDLPEGFSLRRDTIKPHGIINLDGPDWAFDVRRWSRETEGRDTPNRSATSLMTVTYPALSTSGEASAVDTCVRESLALTEGRIRMLSALASSAGQEVTLETFNKVLMDNGWAITDVEISAVSPQPGVDVSSGTTWEKNELQCILISLSVTLDETRPAVIWSIFTPADVSEQPKSGSGPRTLETLGEFCKDLAAVDPTSTTAVPTSTFVAEDPVASIERSTFLGWLGTQLSKRDWSLGHGPRTLQLWGKALKDRKGNKQVLACFIYNQYNVEGTVFRWRVVQRSIEEETGEVKIDVLLNGTIASFEPAEGEKFLSELDKVSEDVVSLKAAPRKGAVAPEVLSPEDIAKWTWDKLILPDSTLKKLKQLQLLIEDPSKAAALGIEPPRGALLSGPPGCGKTTIARVLAAQTKAAFFNVKASDLLGMYNGQTEKAITALFESAAAAAPAIIFIDEIEGLAQQRGNPLNPGWKDAQLNALLVEVDGLARNPGIFVIGATNRADMLDAAMTRGGRFGFEVAIGLPDEAARVRQLELFTAKMPLADDVDLAKLAREGTTRELSPADLEGLCQLAGLEALTRDSEATKVSAADFMAAFNDLSKKETKKPRLLGFSRAENG